MPALSSSPELRPGDAVRAGRIAGVVLGYLERELIPPTPRLFQLFFEHEARSDPGASTDDAERRLETAAPLVQAVAAEAAATACTIAGIEVAATLVERADTLGRSVDAVRATVETYDAHLETATEAFDSAGMDQNALGIAVRALAYRHRTLMDANAALRDELEAAQGELDAVRQQLLSVARQSLLDPVTGLANRRGAEAMLATALAEFGQGESPVAVAMIDIDRFKPLNDAYGHPAGDRVLHEVARALMASVGAGEEVFRFGGDEFAAVLRPHGANEVGAKAERLRQSVTEINLARCVGGGVLGNVTVSLGVASCTGADSVASLLARADASLFEAKNAGRNRWVLAED